MNVSKQTGLIVIIDGAMTVGRHQGVLDKSRRRRSAHKHGRCTCSVNLPRGMPR